MTGQVRPLLRLAGRVFGRAHLIEAGKAEEILAALGGRLGVVAEAPAAASPAMAAEEAVELPAGTPRIAIIGVHGTLVARASWLDAESGLTSYEALLCELRAARDDAAVKAILLDIDSCGGECDGAFDLADEIHAARAAKPVWAVANHRAYSSAYAIAAATDRVWVSRTGGVGSIGVFWVHRDLSRADEKAGVTYTPIFAGARKMDGWEHAGLSDEARKAAAGDIARIYGLFTSSVARWRGMDEGAVRATEAGTYMGEAAVEAGLADDIGTIDDALAALSAELTTSSERSINMATKHRPLSAAQPKSRAAAQKVRAKARRPRAEEGEDTVIGAEDESDDDAMEGGDDTVIGAEDDDTVVGAEGEDDEERAEDEEDEERTEEDERSPAARAAFRRGRASASAILDICALAGASVGQAATYVSKGRSAASVRRELLAARTDGRRAGRPIRPQHGAPSSGEAASVLDRAFARHQPPARR